MISRAWQIHQGDVRQVLAEMPAESVQTVVTSPPYWGLRDYSVEGQIGLERTPDEYVQTMVDVFRGVRRVLRSDGTLWLNLGDSYAGSGPNRQENVGNIGSKVGEGLDTRGGIVGLKPKDLCMIPARVALALQADGWWLRSVIIWAKPNPMPESVTDRPTTAHEYIYLLAKSSTYYYDADAIREPHLVGSGGRQRAALDGSFSYAGADFKTHHVGNGHDGLERSAYNPAGRNKRTVWNVATSPFSGAHFATFPPKLIEPCILAGTSERGCCPECGAPWERLSEATGHVNQREPAHVPGKPTKVDSTGWAPTRRPTDNWQPTCKCPPQEPVPCVVLDPFAGAGTTLMVALRHGRRAVGIELSAEYIRMAEGRIVGDAPLFNTIDVEEGMTA